MTDENPNSAAAPPQAADDAADASTAAENEAESLSDKSISQLRALAKERNVDLTGCLEKSDMVERITAAPPAAAAPAAAPNAHAFNFNLGAAAAESDSDDDDEEEDDDDDEHQNMMQMLPACIIRRVEHLRDLNTQRKEIEEQYQAERAALEQKFSQMYQPLFDERAEVVAGKHDADIDKKAKAAAEAAEDRVESGAGAAEEEESIVGVPQFWVCAMGHMEAVAELITERDVDCLEALTDIKTIDNDAGDGFALEFHFRENDYFSNKVLRKTYSIPNLLLADEPILKNVTGCDIDWKPNMCLTHREIKKKQRAKAGKKAGQIRTIVKKEKAESFFHFFSPPKIPTMDAMDEEEADAIEQAFDMDYDVAQAFRSHIIPKAALWFTGEALDEGFEIPEGEWPGENDDDDEDAAEGVDASGAAAAPAAPAAASPFPPPAEGEENPECKQN